MWKKHEEWTPNQKITSSTIGVKLEMYIFAKKGLSKDLELSTLNWGKNYKIEKKSIFFTKQTRKHDYI